jgi:hypothetical protein
MSFTVQWLVSPFVVTANCSAARSAPGKADKQFLQNKRGA